LRLLEDAEALGGRHREPLTQLVKIQVDSRFCKRGQLDPVPSRAQGSDEGCPCRVGARAFKPSHNGLARTQASCEL
jgi:hypothetical protein